MCYTGLVRCGWADPAFRQERNKNLLIDKKQIEKQAISSGYGDSGPQLPEAAACLLCSFLFTYTGNERSFN